MSRTQMERVSAGGVVHSALSVRPRFDEVFFAPLSAARPDPNDPRAVLDFCAPDNLAQLVSIAANEACAAYAHVLSNATRGQMNLVVGRAQTEVRSLQPLWAALDREQRYGVWNSIERGFTADEAQVGAQFGAVMGSLFGFEDVGRVLGGALGGLLVGHKHEEETRRASEHFQTAIQSWFQRLAVALQSEILPLVQRDEVELAREHGDYLLSSSTGRNKVVALVAALAIVGGGAVAAAVWLRSGSATPSVSLPTTVTAMATSEPPPAAPASPVVSAELASPKPRAAVHAPAAPPPSRGSCLQACVAKCNDNPNCERSCAAGCPPK